MKKITEANKVALIAGGGQSLGEALSYRLADEVEQVYIDKVPLKRGCTYDDIANAVIFYASDNAGYMTGQSINVTGGQVMH